MANTTNFNWETPDDTDLVKDGAAAIRTLGNSIDTSFVDLKGGTTGQILSKASNTDLDYTWINSNPGDITAVTAGTGISGGGTSGDVTITNSMATAIDAKGDLIAGTADNAFSRLAVGSNGQILIADSTTATGLRWQSPSSPVNSYSLLGSANLAGSASITINFAAVNRLFVYIAGATRSGSGISAWLRLNGDASSIYPQTFQSMFNANFGGGFTQTTRIDCGFASADQTISAFVEIDGAAGTGVKSFNGTSGSSDSNEESRTFNGMYSGTSTITSINISGAGGTFTGGSVSVYGY